MTPDLSIVIVNHNSRQLLIDCLTSIYDKQSAITFECIVVDNASSDDSVEAVKSTFPTVRIIENQVGRYFSGGNNQGVAIATGRYIVVINPDMVVLGDTLAQLVAQMDAHPEIGAATTVMRWPDGGVQRNGSEEVTLWYLILQYTFVGRLLPALFRQRRATLWYEDWDRLTPRQIGVMPGCCIIASQAVWSATHGFDERMPMYFADDYLSLAVRQLGKQTTYLISDGIIHYEGSITRDTTKQTLTRRYLRMYFDNLLTYTRLVFGLPATILLTILLIPTLIFQFLKAR